MTYLIIVGAVGALFDAGVFPLISHLDAHNGVHVQPSELPRLDDGDAQLEVLRLQQIRWCLLAVSDSQSTFECRQNTIALINS